jgi:hypothetical protein
MRASVQQVQSDFAVRRVVARLYQPNRNFSAERPVFQPGRAHAQLDSCKVARGLKGSFVVHPQPRRVQLLLGPLLGYRIRFMSRSRSRTPTRRDARSRSPSGPSTARSTIPRVFPRTRRCRHRWVRAGCCLEAGVQAFSVFARCPRCLGTARWACDESRAWCRNERRFPREPPPELMVRWAFPGQDVAGWNASEPMPLADVLVAVFETGTPAGQAACSARRPALLAVAKTALNCVEESIMNAEQWFLVSRVCESREHYNKELIDNMALWNRWLEVSRRWQAA